MTNAPQKEQMIGSTLSYPGNRVRHYTRHAELLSTGVGIPEVVVSNQDLIDQFDLIASDRAVQFSVGIRERRQTLAGNPPSHYLAIAATMCMERANLSLHKVDRIIYARLSGDHAVPSTAIRVLERLGLSTGIPVMDISVACSGFVHALDLAQAYIEGGDDYVLILSGDRTVMDKEAKPFVDPRTVFLNGSGFAAALIGHCATPKFKASYFYTDSSIGDYAYMPFGSEAMAQGGTLTMKSLMLAMPNGPNIHQSIVDSCRIISQRLLSQANLGMNDIDFFISSDQTTLSWKAQLSLLQIDEFKSCSCFHKYGNTVAAMVPLNLHEAIHTGKLQRGMTVMLMGHGAGASGGGFIFTY